MFSFGSNKNPEDPTQQESSAVDDDGTDETHPEDTLFLDFSEGLVDEEVEETIEFNEMYGSAVPDFVDDCESYDPYIRYAYTRKIDGTDFVRKRVSVLRRRRRYIYGAACVILFAVATAIGITIYKLVNVELERKNDNVALGTYSENKLIKDNHKDENGSENDLMKENIDDKSDNVAQTKPDRKFSAPILGSEGASSTDP